MLIILFYYTAISKENICLLTKQVWGKATWAIRVDLKAYYEVTLITKLFHVNINCTCFFLLDKLYFKVHFEELF